MNDNHKLTASTLKEKILAARDLSRESVFVKEWDLTLYIQEMSAADKLDYQRCGIARGDDGEIILGPDGVTPVVNKGALGIFQEALLVRTLVDSKGKRVFTNDEIDMLKQKSAAVLERLHELSAKLNKTRLKDQEVVEGN